jgi:putative ABC transport system ATP-binding protein
VPSRQDQGIVELVNVSKDYASGAGVVRALREVSLTIEKGEFVAIVGASGSGKSTLMNILGCLDRPTRGTYHLSGVEVGTRSNDGRAIVRNRLIGFIFQGFNLLPRTTALENCELPLQYRGHAVAARRKRALHALDMVGLADRVHHTPNQLSGGQQQRVAIARALVTDPPLLLADEPTGNLDTRTSLEVLALLQKLNRENGITIALVTHEHDIAACASRVITVRDGKIVSDVVQEARLDAAAALAALPPPQIYETDAAPISLSPRERLRQKLGGPVPISLYAAMFGAGLGGALLGLAYGAVVLGQRVAWVVALCMVVSEAWVGARLGAKRQQGKPLTADQRGRVAIVYTCAVTLPVTALVLALAVNKLPLAWLDGVEHLSSGGVALVLLTSLVALAALSLLRFLLLSLLAPRVRREAPSVASEAP